LIEASYSQMLGDLSNDYYQNRIEFEEYRNRRKMILDKIDVEFNGDKPEIEVIVNQDQKSEFMQTIAFYQNSDVEK
jgi:hypothetical protein